MPRKTAPPLLPPLGNHCVTQTSQEHAAKRAVLGVQTGAGVPACVSQGMGTGKAQLFAASATGVPQQPGDV